MKQSIIGEYYTNCNNIRQKLYTENVFIPDARIPSHR